MLEFGLVKDELPEMNSKERSESRALLYLQNLSPWNETKKKITIFKILNNSNRCFHFSFAKELAEEIRNLVSKKIELYSSFL